MLDRIFAGVAGEGPKPERIMIDATHLKAHRAAASLLKKGMFPRRIGRTKGGLNSKLHTVCDGEGRPIILLLSEGQMSDHKGARLVLNALPPASHLIAATTVPSSGSNSQPGASTRASPRAEAVKSHTPTTLRSTATATRSEPVRKAQGLEAYRNPLRPMRPHLLLRHLAQPPPKRCPHCRRSISAKNLPR